MRRRMRRADRVGGVGLYDGSSPRLSAAGPSLGDGPPRGTRTPDLSLGCDSTLTFRLPVFARSRPAGRAASKLAISFWPFAGPGGLAGSFGGGRRGGSRLNIAANRHRTRLNGATEPSNAPRPPRSEAARRSSCRSTRRIFQEILRQCSRCSRSPQKINRKASGTAMLAMDN
jgi:hypothetical protein